MLTVPRLDNEHEYHISVGPILKLNKQKLEVHLAGGLGNQLFQYYAGLHVARLLDRDLVLIASNIDYRHTPGLFDIQSFDIKALVKTKEDRDKAKVGRIYMLLMLKIATVKSKFARLGESKEEIQGSFAEVSNLIEVFKFRKMSRIQMRGYFQDFSFYNNVKNVNQNLHLIEPTERFRILYQECLRIKPIGVHVRLGDFLDGNNRLAIGNLSAEFYLTAFSALKELGIIAPIWVFSNDKLGAIQLFEGKLSDFDVKFIDSNPDIDPAEDLLLMSYCRALVAANSTYSFWAGALGGPNLQVVYPKEFTRSDIYKVLGIPSYWKAIPSLWN